jgi:hypothetical protein
LKSESLDVCPRAINKREKGRSATGDRPFSFVFSYRLGLVTSPATAAATAAVVAASAATTAASGAAFLCLEAVATEDRTIAPGFEGHRGLLSASGADNRRSRGCAGAITASASAVAASAAKAATTGLIGLLGLSARLAALRRRISPFLEERLVSSSKCEFPSAVATGKLQISSHGISPFSV